MFPEDLKKWAWDGCQEERDSTLGLGDLHVNANTQMRSTWVQPLSDARVAVAVPFSQTLLVLAVTSGMKSMKLPMRLKLRGRLLVNL